MYACIIHMSGVWEDKNGEQWRSAESLPTICLDENILGIVSEESAEGMMTRILQDICQFLSTRHDVSMHITAGRYNAELNLRTITGSDNE